jgi:phosphate uptake regulator
MALVARFYERLGDHAVNIASRVRYLARGER